MPLGNVTRANRPLAVDCGHLFLPGPSKPFSLQLVMWHGSFCGYGQARRPNKITITISFDFKPSPPMGCIDLRSISIANRHFRCTKSFTSMSSFETYPTARISQEKGPRRYSPSRPPANPSKDPSWTFCGDVRLTYPQFSRPSPPAPGLLLMVFLYVEAVVPDRVVNLTCFLSPCRGIPPGMNGDGSKNIQHA